MDDRVSVAPPVDDGRRQGMRVPDEVAAMLRLRALGWGTRRIAAELGCNRETVRRYLAAGGWAPYRAPARPGCWPATGRGWPSGSAATAATPTWCARSWRPSWASPSACARSSGRWRTCGASCGGGAGDGALRDAAGQPDADRLRRVRVTIGGERCGSICSSPPWATRVASMSAPSGTSGSRPGSRASRARSGTSAGCPRSCCSTTPAPWSSTTTPARGRWCSTRASTPSPATGTCGRWPARPTGPGPRARTSAGSATSSATPSPGAASPAGRRWRRTWPGGRARSPTCASTARRARRRSRASSATRRRRCARWRRPPFRQLRELTRRVQNDGCVDVDTNHYSVPWRLIGAGVSVVVSGGEVRVLHAGVEVARHGQRRGRRERAVDRPTCAASSCDGGGQGRARPVPPGAELLRPLAEYERVAGGAW